MKYIGIDSLEIKELIIKHRMTIKKFAASFSIALIATGVFFAALTFLVSKQSGFAGFFVIHYLIPAIIFAVLVDYLIRRTGELVRRYSIRKS